MIRVSACTAGLLFPAALSLPAQGTSASLEVGAARMRFADSIGATALMIAPALRTSGARYTVDAAGTLARLGDGWSSSGATDVVLVAARRGRLALEGEGLGGGSLHSGGTYTAQLLGAARLRAGFASASTWIAAGAGQTWDAEWRTLRRVELGGWMRRRASTFAATVQPTVVADTIRFTDSFVAWSADVDAWAFSAAVGFRGGAQLPSLPANRKSWGSVTATRALRPGVALVGSAGTYPVDFTQGYPGGRYLSLGVRWRFDLDEAAVSAPATPDVLQLRLEPSGEGAALSVFAPRANAVEVTGDFTSWSPVPLQRRGGGWWALALPIARGTHEMNVRVDGGPWQVPPGTIPKKDEFGTTAGVLVVR